MHASQKSSLTFNAVVANLLQSCIFNYNGWLEKSCRIFHSFTISFCYKKVLCSVYRQVLKNIHKFNAVSIESCERRTLIVSDILHGVLVLVHPNLHLPCWELFDEHVRNRNECIYTYILCNLPLRTKIHLLRTVLLYHHLGMLQLNN